VEPDPPAGPSQGTVPPALSTKDAARDKPSAPAGAEAIAPAVPAEALGEALPADNLAAAVSSTLPRGTIVFESMVAAAADATASGDPAAQPLREQYVTERRAETLATLERHRMTFFSDVSQECRAPLALILGPAANLLAGVHGPLSDEQRDQIRIVHQNGVHLLKLVNTLFTFLRIESGVHEVMWQLPEDIAGSAPSVVDNPAATDATRADGEEGRILIADDHAGVRRHLERLLGKRWQTEVVSDGQAAFETARARRPDLIIADVTMPVLDGLGLLRALRADPRTDAIPVLLVSGNGTEESRVEGLLAGAADYLVKPFSDGELVAKVQSQLQAANDRRKDALHIASWAAFHAAASHELRNPIHSLQLQVLALLRGLQGEQATPQLEWVHTRVVKANDQLSRVIRLLDRLLDVSRITSGGLPLEFETVDLAEVAGTAIDWLEPAEQAQITRRFEPVSGQWDRLRLEQIVTNLVTNALKYGAGQPIDVVVRGDEESARLSVTDRGIGIAAEHQERIFQRFERAVTDERYSGFGLGLWITRQIVDELGGTMSLQSVPGEGSTFIVELPREPRER
jgi:signal transduction histidine kinase